MKKKLLRAWNAVYFKLHIQIKINNISSEPMMIIINLCCHIFVQLTKWGRISAKIKRTLPAVYFLSYGLDDRTMRQRWIHGLFVGYNVLNCRLRLRNNASNVFNKLMS